MFTEEVTLSGKRTVIGQASGEIHYYMNTEGARLKNFKFKLSGKRTEE